MQAGVNGMLGDSMLFGAQQGSTLSFVAQNGELVALRRKKKSGSHDTSWRHDETYGIDINQLLDQCDSHSGNSKDVKLSRPTGNLSGKLWTEKWRPSSFFDLVGNEKTNRRVLKWLRQWSPLVFGEVLPTKGSNQWRGANTRPQDSPEHLDPLQRPHKKILLINGPPGIGKTSVAHVVAKQAGYSIMEINASDERAGPRVKDRVHNALFSNTLDERPVCLIADEIDGSIESGFVKVLVDIINNDFKATQRLLSGAPIKSKGKRQRKKAQGQIMTRPIITICNNVYASALEKLRPHCEIITFQRPSENAIVERLFHVCHKERLHMDKKRLKELTENFQGDVRSCLNNMQFLATLASDTDSSGFGDHLKDMTVPWFKICNQMFQKNPHVDVKYQFEKLLRDVETNSNYQKIVHGCFLMFPNVKYSDQGLRKPSVAADWLYFNDLMFKSLFEHNGDLLRYNSAVPMAFFNLFSDIANKDDVRTQHNEFEQREILRRNEDIIIATLRRTSPGSQIYMNKKALTLEILPLLDHMIAADFSKVRNGLVKNALFSNMVSAITGFNLTFGERVDTDLPRITCIEPPFDKVILMNEKRVKEVFTKRPALLNVVSAKVQESVVRKRTIENAKTEKEDLETARKRQKSSLSKPADYFRSQYANVQKKGAPLYSEQEATGQSSQEHIKIWIKYKEGFSDAVRKNVTWNALWE
ncbi:LANO_0D06040g1_1 [Lachancea nothofagi CBS 11611]|uniref:LANO_0D06040g1_1 n=1 Tax=Lachancea nothofagi CBS 11611 TaxID=1266666 RepID=A0A1G4JHB7_9SACH|nr:LANO_0D06040g1_1 [Lachancea nothofagi CBS 11611]